MEQTASLQFVLSERANGVCMECEVCVTARRNDEAKPNAVRLRRTCHCEEERRSNLLRVDGFLLRKRASHDKPRCVRNDAFYVGMAYAKWMATLRSP